MSKQNSPHNDKKSKDYYKLNTKAVDRLVNADKVDIPKDKILRDPAKQYRSDLLDRIPSPVKSLFIKWWFNAAACFFFIWALGLTDYLDILVITSITIGMTTDILVNNILRFIEIVPGENAKWMMFTKKKYWTFIANILYSFLIIYCVMWLYNGINILINSITGNVESVPFGVEPILFGIFYMLFDILFISMKNLMLSIINDAKNKINKQ